MADKQKTVYERHTMVTISAPGNLQVYYPTAGLLQEQQLDHPNVSPSQTTRRRSSRRRIPTKQVSRNETCTPRDSCSKRDDVSRLFLDKILERESS